MLERRRGRGAGAPRLEPQRVRRQLRGKGKNTSKATAVPPYASFEAREWSVQTIVASLLGCAARDIPWRHSHSLALCGQRSYGWSQLGP